MTPLELRDAINTNVDIRLQNAGTVFESQNQWSVRDHEKLEYKLNPKFWMYGTDFSGCAVSHVLPNGTVGWKKTITLITPSIGICSNHYTLPAGTTVYFRDKNGEVIGRKIAQKVAHPWYKLNTNFDFNICLFDEPFPSTVSPLHILPDDWKKYIDDNGKGLPILQFDQIDDVGCAEIFNIDNGQGLHQNQFPPNGTRRREFYENLVGGDSSDPCILMIYDYPILLTTWRYGGAGVGCSLVSQSKWVDDTCMNLANEKPLRYDLSDPKAKPRKRTCGPIGGNTNAGVCMFSDRYIKYLLKKIRRVFKRR